MDILQMSLSAAVLVIAVVTLRALMLYKLPKKTFLILWGVVLCRLLIPFSIPSHLSFYTGVDKLLMQTPVQTTPIAAATIPAAIPAPVTGIGGVPADGGSSSMPVTPVLFIWLGGMCLCALFFTISYFRCRREFETAIPVESDIITAWKQAHPMRRPVHIRQSDRLSAPLTYGVFRPVVLVPKTTDWADKASLQYILAHEYVHIRRFDALSKLLLTAALCVHWFNPLVWVMYLLANRDIELSCDEAVVRIFTGSPKTDYALALISLEEKKRRLTPLCNSFSKNAIDERIKAIMRSKRFTVPAIIAAVMIIIAVTLVFATSKAEPTSAADAQDNTTVYEENAELRQHLREVVITDDVPTTAVGAPTDNTLHVPEATPAAAQIISEEGWVWPVAECVVVTSRFGSRFHPIYKEYILSDHVGIGANMGAAVSAALDGTVSEAEFDSEQGNYIVIDHDDGIQTVYRHLSERCVIAGDTVTAGDTIGLVGKTGNATGPFLAFCVCNNGNFVDPLKKYYKDMFPNLFSEPAS